MSSQLHDRLEYLVNFSSQLIFVSGDSIAQQQRTLEEFIFQQHDDSEIAFLTAEPGLEISAYRRQLCRQLLGQQVGSFVRPLNELLAELNGHEGPVLVAITQAQHIPDTLLQELWDLVLQSRFKGNKQHLNVLLFGESQWAEQAKQWLPAKNTTTPLLISSQSVTRDHYTSSLDKMIAERREAFHQRMSNRYAPASDRPNRLRSPWFWAGMAAVLISFFVALMGWQYGTTLSTLFNPIETAAKPTEQQTQPLATTTESSEPVASTAEPLVGEWPGASDKVEPPTTNESAIDEEIEPQPITEASEPETLVEESIPPQQVIETAEEQPAVVMAEPTAQIAPPSTEETTANSWVVGIEASYLIQLAGLKDAQLMQDFIRDNSLEGKVWTYTTQRYGGDWHVLVWGDTYPSLASAREAATELPDFPGRENAFVKSGEQILEEIRSL